MLQDEVYRISRGVIRNAFAHAAAAHIEVEIRYDQDQLRLRVRDDGKESIPSCWRPGDSKDTLAYRHARTGAANRVAAGILERSRRGHRGRAYVPASMAYQKQRDGRRI